MADVHGDSTVSSPDHIGRWWGPPAMYPEGVHLFRQDAPSTNVYFIERGLVKLTRIDENGNEIIAGIRRKHWMVGAPAVLLKKPYSFTVTTLTECHLRALSADGFLELARRDDTFNAELTRVLSQEIYEQARMVTALGCLTARDRLMQLLTEFIREMQRPPEAPEQFKLSIPLKHKELAQMVAITPEHLSRLLGRLEAEGLIARKKNAIIIKKNTSDVSGVPT